MQSAPPPSTLRRIHTLLQFSRLNSKAAGYLAAAQSHSYITHRAECPPGAGKRVHKGKKEQELTFQGHHGLAYYKNWLLTLLTDFNFVEVYIFFFLFLQCRAWHSSYLHDQWKHQNEFSTATCTKLHVLQSVADKQMILSTVTFIPQLNPMIYGVCVKELFPRQVTTTHLPDRSLKWMKVII